MDEMTYAGGRIHQSVDHKMAVGGIICRTLSGILPDFNGGQPPNPRDLPLYGPKYEKGKGKGPRRLARPPYFGHLPRRSGRFPALPYPPGRQCNDIIVPTGLNTEFFTIY